MSENEKEVQTSGYSANTDAQAAEGEDKTAIHEKEPTEAEVVSTPSPDVVVEPKKNEEKIPDPAEEIITSPRQAVFKAFRKSGLHFKEEEADQLVELVKDYYANRSIATFARMPKLLQNIIKKSCATMVSRGMKNVNREQISKMMLDDVINTAGFEVAVTNLKDEIKLKLAESNKELRELVDHAYKSAFDNIEEIRKENPKKAENIEKVQSAFKKAEDFTLQQEYLDCDTPRNIKRYHQHYNDDVMDFKAKTAMNNINLTIPSLDHLLNYLQKATKGYSNDVMKGFVVLLARSTKDLDYSDLHNVAYIYKLMANIYQYGLTPNQKTDTMIKGIISIMDQIKKIIEKPMTAGEKFDRLQHAAKIKQNRGR